MKNFILPILLFALSACDNAKYETSEILHEEGIVYDSIFVPEGHGSDIEFNIDADGNFSIDTVSVHMPERYAVVFKCQHGKFIIANTNKAKELYHRLSRNQKVDITYTEITKITKDKSGVEEQEIKQLHDFDFIDAIAIQ